MVHAHTRFYAAVSVFMFLFFAAAHNAYATPSVTVGYPNGGECVVAGSPITITWSGAGYDHVAIAYRADSAGAPSAYLVDPSAWNIAHGVTGTSYIWTGTASAPAGTPLKIWIEAEGPGDVMLAVDSSNMSFGIASSSCSTTTTTVSNADTTPPSVPVAGAVTNSSSSITVSWAAATDNVAVTGYAVYRNGVHLTNTTALSYQDSALAASTAYAYTVAAYDAAGNMSSQSAPASATTLASSTGTTTGTTTTTTTTTGTTPSADTTAPVFSTVRPENIMGSGAQIKWTTDDLSDSRVAYGTVSGSYTLFSNNRCDAGGNVTDHCVNLTGLSAGATYYYKTESLNTANLDGYSAGYSFVAATSGTTNTAVSTTASTTPATAPTGTTASSTATTMPSGFTSDAQVSGSVVDALGQVVSSANGYISTYNASASSHVGSSSAMPAMMFGGTIDKGNFSFPILHGTYTLTLYFPSSPAFAIPSPQAITVAQGETKQVNFVVGKNDATISGFLKDASGNVITGFDPAKVKVYVSSHAGAWYNAAIDASKGTFSAHVGAGTWYLGYWADASSGYVSRSNDIAVTVVSGGSASVDLALARSDSFVSGMVSSADGKPLAGAWVSVDQRSFSSGGTLTQAMAGSPTFMAGGNSDATGAYRISVPQGVYFVHAYLPASSGYINPPETSVTMGAGQTATANLVFKKPDAVISGTVSSDGKGVPAFAWAWADGGGYAASRADAQGKYSLTVSRNQRWHINAAFESAGAYFKSSDLALDIKDDSALAQDIVVLPVAMPAAAVEKVVDTVKAQTMELADGAKAILPANALSTAGSADVSMKPSVETPSFGSSSVVGTSYKVEAKDTAGKSITVLNAEMTITIPYDDKELEAKGLRPEDLALSFYDESTGAWKSLEKQVVDKTAKTVSGTVSHLTLFALVAPADTTPPPAPSAISVSVSAEKVTLAWTNPGGDFHHIKIYRSAAEKTLGEAAFNYVTGTTQTDTLKGTAAYYTVRAVDLAGNESTNTAQYKAQEGMSLGDVQSSGSASGVMLVKTEGDGAVYAVVRNIKRHIPSSAAFTAAGFRWSDIKTISASDMARYTQSSLIKTADDPRVYILQGDTKRWIQSAEEFNVGGYKWDQIVEVSSAELAAYGDAAGTPSASGGLARDLKFGAYGADVRIVQGVLAKDKSIYPLGKVTGYFGKATQAAVRKFQQKYGIAETAGVVGPKTRAKINELTQ